MQLVTQRTSSTLHPESIASLDFPYVRSHATSFELGQLSFNSGLASRNSIRLCFSNFLVFLASAVRTMAVTVLVCGREPESRVSALSSSTHYL